MAAMCNIGRTVLSGLAVIAIGAFWPTKTTAQEKPGVVTVFDHKILDVSFDKALSHGGTNLLWNHTSNGTTYKVDVHSRESMKSACKSEGCSHTGYTAVVYVVSGAATLVIGGTVKAAGPDKFGGASVQGGESHRISKGDVYIVPPSTLHWYKNVERPFRYIEVPIK
jgi:mannose-6-phosphate isomerase-like protein (cupin superfamily)